MGFQQSHKGGSRYPQGNTLKTNELFYLPSQWGAQSPTHCDNNPHPDEEDDNPHNGVRNPQLIATVMGVPIVVCLYFSQWGAQSPTHCDGTVTVTPLRQRLYKSCLI